MVQEVTQQFYAPEQAARIKLIGVGGGGCNAVEQMIAADIHGVDFTLVNTDAQALARYNPDNVIQLGSSLTRGLGAGTDPEVGRLAAEEDADIIAATIGDTDMLFLTAGMGGGTGTGAIPVIARIARELGVLTVAVVTKPFGFEGGKRKQVAEAGLAELGREVDSLIVVPNENLLTNLGPNVSLIEAFSASNDVLTNAVQSIAELITSPGLINVDFADVKSVMTETGEAMMSTGRGIGEYRARDAAIAATESPLLEEINLNDARGILANVTASDSLSMGEFQIVGDILDQITANDANVVIGTVFDPEMNDEIRVTVVATGLQSTQQRRPAPARGQKKSGGFLGFGAREQQPRERQPSRKEASNLRYRRSRNDFAEQAPKPRLVETRAPRREENRYEEPEYLYEEEDLPPARDIAAKESAVAPVADALNKYCQACGNEHNNHSANCPLQEAAATQASAERRPTFVKDDRISLEDTVRELQHKPKAPQKKKKPAKNQATTDFGTGIKKPAFNKHVAGLVAGTVVLMSVFYVLISKSGEPENSTVVSSPGNSETLAERKLREAQRRLSGLDQ